jgi:hypothetical protein
MDNKGVVITNPKTGKEYELIEVIHEGGTGIEAPSVEQEYREAKKAMRDKARRITQQNNLPLRFPEFDNK